VRINYLLILFFFYSLFASELTLDKSADELSLKLTDKENYSVLTFRKSSGDSVFTFLKYSKSRKMESLASECRTIDSLWVIAEKAEKDAKIELSSASIGYPLEYPDIMPDYIQAFLDSEEWQTHATVKGKELNYAVMHDIIRGSTIFSGLVDLMYLHGYYISGISSEKHGFVTKDDLIRYGFKGDEIIPMPFMLYWKVERVKKIK
jgi:hypothetical protein